MGQCPTHCPAWRHEPESHHIRSDDVARTGNTVPASLQPSICPKSRRYPQLARPWQLFNGQAMGKHANEAERGAADGRWMARVWKKGGGGQMEAVLNESVQDGDESSCTHHVAASLAVMALLEAIVISLLSNRLEVRRQSALDDAGHCACISLVSRSRCLDLASFYYRNRRETTESRSRRVASQRFAESVRMREKKMDRRHGRDNERRGEG